MSRILYGQVINGKISVDNLPADIVSAKAVIYLSDEQPAPVPQPKGEGIVLGKYAHLPGRSASLKILRKGVGTSSRTHFMTTKFVIDAHTLIWTLESNPKLSDAAKAVMIDSQSMLIMSAITLAEAFRVVEKGRSKLPDAKTLLKDVLSDRRMTIDPVTRELVALGSLLKEITELHDRLLVSTVVRRAALGEQVVLVTCDRLITPSQIVPVLW